MFGPAVGGRLDLWEGRAAAARTPDGGDRPPEERTSGAADVTAGEWLLGGENGTPCDASVPQGELVVVTWKDGKGGHEEIEWGIVGVQLHYPASHVDCGWHGRRGASAVFGMRGFDLMEDAWQCGCRRERCRCRIWVDRWRHAMTTAPKPTASGRTPTCASARRRTLGRLMGAVVDGAVVFRSPDQQGFWHQHLPSPTAHRSGQDGDLLALTVDTVNSTSWGPLSRYLLTTGAHVLLCQEHHLGPRDVLAAAAFALRHGWQVVMLPAELGEGEGWRAGVAIFARRFIGLGPPRNGSYEVIPARAIAAQIEAPGYRPLTAVAIYLEHGKGIGSPNLQHMETVGLFLEAQGDHVPFIAGGDYQADPGEVARLGFAQRTSASLVASRDPTWHMPILDLHI